jgi:hypothetical protein
MTAQEASGPRLFTRAEAIAALKIGETTLYWLQRTGKLRPIRIGSRVLFNVSEIMRIAAQGATLTEAEKEAAAKHDREKIGSISAVLSTSPQARRRGRSKKLRQTQDVMR